MPLEITFGAGPWIERFKGNRQILAEFGNVRAIARIPGGKPSGVQGPGGRSAKTTLKRANWPRVMPIAL
jgi:hypothetical protein